MIFSDLYNNKAQFVARTVGSELILVPVKSNVADMDKILTLNEVGSFIWGKIDGKNSEEDIVHAVEAEFDVDNETASKDIKEFLNRLYDFVPKI
jgi:hypothetical protein